ncbi:MAG: HEPN domain-containing protein [Candidatus Njordarchaeia archaeon]
MSYLEWFERAKFFLRESERYFNEEIYWAVCYNAHQSAEFSLKGFLYKITGSYPFTHDLLLMLNDIERQGIQVPETVKECADYLTPHYTSARYPGTRSMVYEKNRAQKCLTCAREISKFIEGIM